MIEDTCKMTVGLICNENVELYHEQGERGAGGVERPSILVREQLHGRSLYTVVVLVREDLVVGGVVGPLPLRHFVVDGRDVEDVAERQTQRCRQSTPPRVNRIYDISRVQYHMRRYFNVRSKADTSQLNLPHGTDN